MKKSILDNSVIEILSLLSFLLFLVTSDHLTAPLGLLFLLSIFTDITFINVTFGLGLFMFFLSYISRKGKTQMILKFGYIGISIICIGAIFLANPNMFIELPTLISALVFILFITLLILKWRNKIPTYFGHSIS